MINFKDYFKQKQEVSLREHLSGNPETNENGLPITEADVEFDGTSVFPVNEGFRDIFNAIKRKFSQVISFFKNVVVKSKRYWLAIWEGSVNEDTPEALDAITPFTTAQAYVDGSMNRNKTVVISPSVVSKATGCKAKPKDAIALYGKGNTLQYLKSIPIKESKEQQEALQEFYEECGLRKLSSKEVSNIVNEVKLGNADPSAKYNVFDNDELIDEIDWHLKNPHEAPLLIFGAPGIGKTAILNQILKVYNSKIPVEKDQWQLIVKTLSNETPESFMLPDYLKDADGKNIRAQDLPKTWLPVYKKTGDPARDKAASDAVGRGLLFIDELSRATPQVLNVMLPLINERRINDWTLGENWVIICASNRAEDEMYGQAELGNAMLNRFAIAYYEPTAKTWAQWARKQNYISPLLLDWLQMADGTTHSGAKYFYFDPNEENPDMDPQKLIATPRSWDNAMKRLAAFAQTGEKEGWDILDIPSRIVGRYLGQYIPPQAVDTFLAFLGVIKSVGSMDEFAEGVWSKGKGKLKDPKVLDMIPSQICQILIASKQELPTEKEMVNLFKWLVSVDNPPLAGYLVDMIKNVFGADLPSDSLKNDMFTMHETAKELLAENSTKSQKAYQLLADVHKKNMDRWGISEPKNWPNWIPALDVFFDHPAYAEIFQMADSSGNLIFDKGGRLD